ncbi:MULTISPECIES: NAD(P)/FAD-dependent oxidoreductase [unclassified Streptomyces]|uniref:phytoene desaturase family protein n=1 Tax=unclassified Streptomyces TaxID=2593676 RepID=UPI000BD9C092|nr:MULTISPECIES: NAD(P)/FAD-dependent oxidoreductase [unclassified Streptomyces]MDN3250958.1 NAD(P)/FAD-dependent oxidoreductase [Streptomyces sp. ZSW22]MDN3257802.1 NAD(P)/FAD-dependent oxidoreductase [Streptomyces sp. MA25(2023)]PAK24056.1 dehydrogenase [Streptomyces sp. alain-838]
MRLLGTKGQPRRDRYSNNIPTTDVAIIGTGPNGLAAGVTLARAGLKVELYEASETIGGGLRTQPIFDTDIAHDICSAVHPMAAASRFFRQFDLAARGVELLRPAVSYAHPIAEGRSGVVYHDLEETCSRLGRDGNRWRRLMQPLLQHSDSVVDIILSGQRSLPHDVTAAALLAVQTALHGSQLSPFRTHGGEASALLTGVAAHAMGKLPSLAAGAVTVLLSHLAHGPGWPLPRGGSSQIAEAMARDITSYGGIFHIGRPIHDLNEVQHARLVFLDTSVQGFIRIAGDRLPRSYARQLARFRYGPGAAKVDFLVSDPIPWSDPEIGKAGTVHLGGTRTDILRQETLTARGIQTSQPFVLVVDPAVIDPDRAKGRKRPVWAYAHVPHGDRRDPTPIVREHIERYAPGFTDTILASRGVSAFEMEAHNPNYVGGDIASGAMTLRQSILRPVPQIDPYRTPLPGIYLCSAATPPGPSVHGMSGYLSALSALRREYGELTPPSLAPA